MPQTNPAPSVGVPGSYEDPVLFLDRHSNWHGVCPASSQSGACSQAEAYHTAHARGPNTANEKLTGRPRIRELAQQLD